MGTADGEPVGERTLGWIARGIAVGIFPALWLLLWWHEAGSTEPYADLGRQAFLAAFAGAIAMVAVPFLPALAVVLTRRMTSPGRLLAAAMFAMGAGGTLVSMWARPSVVWFAVLPAGAAVTWVAVRAVALRAGVD